MYKHSQFISSSVAKHKLVISYGQRHFPIKNFAFSNLKAVFQIKWFSKKKPQFNPSTLFFYVLSSDYHFSVSIYILYAITGTLHRNYIPKNLLRSFVLKSTEVFFIEI